MVFCVIFHNTYFEQLSHVHTLRKLRYGLYKDGVRPVHKVWVIVRSHLTSKHQTLLHVNDYTKLS